jgi:threonylcarbamoyladenosine tRNA methylthiotransferase MtaB
MSVHVQTFGCRLNTYESEVMKTHAQSAGMENTLIFNTCAVTAEAERQARQAIRRARREHPDAHIIVTGCAAQINPTSFAEMPEVNAVLGNQEKMEANEWASLTSPLRGEVEAQPRVGVYAAGVDKITEVTPTLALPPQGRGNFSTPSSEKIRVNDIMSAKETAGHLVAAFDGHTRAFVQVQNGCDHRCTFCIIPYGRGNSRSVPMGEIVAQVRLLVEQGYKEVVLTGVDISAYGSDLPGTPSLGQMMRRLFAAVPELPRLRLSSIDAVEVDEDLYRLIAEEPRLMPHLHVSLQAGDDMVLKRMKRRHLRQDALDFCARVRDLRPDVVFGADIIAGFPTETDAMFDNTLRFVEQANLTWLHVFPYSARTGTPAARMPQVPKEVRKERAGRLRALGQEQVNRFLSAQVGRTAQVLVEQDGTGRTEHFAPVMLPGSPLPGSLLHVTVQGTENQRLLVAA